MSFKVGDRVMCIKPDNMWMPVAGVHVGGVYEVKAMSPHGTGNIVVDDEVGLILDRTCFELFDSAEESSVSTSPPTVTGVLALPGLPTEAQRRKAIPLYSGVLKYFPDALASVAELSRVGNDQHNPGKPLHWDRSKSGDELDALARHLIDAGTIDTDGVRHSTKVAWRALANLQKEIEAARILDTVRT